MLMSVGKGSESFHFIVSGRPLRQSSRSLLRTSWIFVDQRFRPFSVGEVRILPPRLLKALLTVNLVKTSMHPVEELPEVELSKVASHHHGVGPTDFTLQFHRKESLWKPDAAFPATDSTRWNFYLGSYVTTRNKFKS